MNPDSEPKQSDIAEKAAEKRSPVFDPTGRIEGLTADETLIFDVRRHPIGLFFLFIQTIFALGLSLTLIFVFLSNGDRSLSGQ